MDTLDLKKLSNLWHTEVNWHIERDSIAVCSNSMFIAS